jgi:hypothetical protein
MYWQPLGAICWVKDGMQNLRVGLAAKLSLAERRWVQLSEIPER